MIAASSCVVEPLSCGTPCSPSPPRDGGGITCYDRVFYLYPWHGSWILLKLADFQSETPYPDLESAAQAALEALADSAQKF